MRVRLSASSCTALPIRLACRILQPVQPQLLSSVTSRRYQHWSSRLNCISTMPPKQATLGYVKSSQTTLGCDEDSQLHKASEKAADILAIGSFSARTAPQRNSSRSCPSPPGLRPSNKMQNRKKSPFLLPQTRSQKPVQRQNRMRRSKQK